MTIATPLSAKLKAICTLALLLITTILSFIPILLIGILKLIPNQHSRLYCTQLVDKIATSWVHLNNLYLDKSQPGVLKVSGMTDLNPKDWYLVVANHQSWLDIVILQHVFNRKIPVLKFFIKDQLKWVPFLGFAWWAMGCPFMKRYSKSYLATHPHKKGKDSEATKKALKLFKKTPSTIMSFIEGTRCTKEKQQLQQSPYQHLLKPKAGGVSFVIGAMNQHINQLLDVTIIYPKHQDSLWQFLCQRIDSIQIHVRQIPIPSQFLLASLPDEEETQSEFRKWLNQQWVEKDAIIALMKNNIEIRHLA